jgi:hypothetical protein
MSLIRLLPGAGTGFSMKASIPFDHRVDIVTPKHDRSFCVISF